MRAAQRAWKTARGAPWKRKGSWAAPAALRGLKARIGDSWVEGRRGHNLEVLDPATGDLVATVPSLGAEDTDHAIGVAAEAQARWKLEPAAVRAGVLQEWFRIITGPMKEDIAETMTLESGKPLSESRGEVDYAASFIEFFAEQAKRINGDIIPAPSASKRILVTKEPVGVVAAITPWNFPAAMITRKVGPALAAGCSVLVKPAEATPLTALLLAKAAEEAGLPPGLLNVLPASRDDGIEVAKALCTDPRVRKLSFTGSTEVGRTLYANCADTVKKLSLELGGNAPFIVFDGCDIPAAVEGLMASKFRNAGQTCVCVNRVLVQDGAHDAFVEQLAFGMGKLNVGHGMDGKTTIGPLINQAAKEKVEGLVQEAKSAGASEVSLPAYSETGFADSNFHPPMLLLDIKPSMRIAQEEIFGPVLVVTRFADEADAVRMANDTIYGLASYFYSRDVAQCFRVADALEYGIIGINEGLISTEVAPFGGIKSSGLGREGSVHGIDDFVEMKYLCFGNIGAAATGKDQKD